MAYVNVPECENVSWYQNGCGARDPVAHFLRPCLDRLVPYDVERKQRCACLRESLI
jgi:hypothetical protein